MEFELVHVFSATPEEVYRAFLSSDEHSKMTGAEAEVSDRIGGNFTAWDGYISGHNLELVEGKKIVQNWRTDDFEEGQPDSLLEIQLEPIENGQTALKLIHKDLPESDTQYVKGWQDYYFNPMEIYFSSLKK